MQFAPILKQARTLRNFYYVRDYPAARTMTELRLDRRSCSYDRATGAYWVRELDLYLAPEHHDLLSQVWQAVALKEAGVSFSNHGSDIVADTGAFSVVLDTPEELFLLHEIIVGGVYNVVTGRQACVVLDIGMNVGFASLYFAAQPWVEAVWSYEPVPETYTRALRNLERNPSLAARITPHNFGLSDAAGPLTFDYCSRWAAAVGISGLNAEFRRSHGISQSDIRSVTVDVRDVRSVIAEVRSAHAGTQLVVKIDCEGAEYAIIAALHSAGLLRQADAFLIEWHQRGPGELEAMLSSAGFFVVSLTPHARATGMIYAHRAAESVGII